MNQLLETISRLSWIDIVFILAVPFAFAFIVKGLWVQIKYIKRVRENAKRLEAQKCKGPHSWIKMPILGQEIHVCKDCCFSADVDTYIKREFVEGYIKELEFRESLDEFANKRKTEIAEEYNMSKDELEELIFKIICIEKDFTLQWLEKSLKEMREEKSEEV